MLELKDIRWTTEDGEEILKGINLSVPDGKLTVVTGPNGGGKTSLAKVVAGLYKASDGKIFIDDNDITDWSITERSKNGIAYAFQQPVRFKGLTVRDLLEISAERTLSSVEICSLLSEVGLCGREYMDREADASLSGGESKRIEIATVLARKNAKMLVFDEPEAGIDLWSFTNLIKAFEEIKTDHSRSLLIISHQERIMNIADYIAVVADGKVSRMGTREEILPTLMNETGSACCSLRNK
ncbi:MAG: ATP-binding cassette domain-containing protein [Oscillospiraceae bacterium]|nr:ATP-binding cassette domain-containing protein [Ruminococcus sp.]MBP1564816.1 ATP-binding cassette domain-containing protein [Oscillospiraceae bacterium]MBQ9981174.1 ATP-binding cassette domain-containing protein [Oscillospiraceae bacterium]MBR6598962.1 ATP-binding cassette domain-containing protein [Oscillospiraceae bacterium]